LPGRQRVSGFILRSRKKLNYITAAYPSPKLKKIVITGPESTGKSTLSSRLALQYNCSWCPEYAREFLMANGPGYTYDDLLTIAKGQLELEEVYTRLASREKNPLLFIDTDMYVMKTWCEFVFGKCHRFILEQAAIRKYDLYLLCDTDLPWSADPLREYPDLESRRKLFLMYQDILVNQSTPWTIISGTSDERLEKAIIAIESLHY
jgi:NadR type nicotinamide-nucleotide adenylyltransferase